MNVSGHCFPCKNIQEAALLVQMEKVNTPTENINDVVKMGKEAGIWYVVIQGVSKT